MKYFKFILLSVVLLIDGYLCYHASLDVKESSEKSDTVTDIVINTVDKITNSEESIENKVGREKISLFVRKLFGHFGLFCFNGILSIIVGYLFINKKCLLSLIVLLHGLIIASTTEIIQLFKDGRHGTIKDVIIDYTGYLIGISIVFVIYIIFRKKVASEEKKL